MVCEQGRTGLLNSPGLPLLRASILDNGGGMLEKVGVPPVRPMAVPGQEPARGGQAGLSYPVCEVAQSRLLKTVESSFPVEGPDRSNSLAIS